MSVPANLTGGISWVPDTAAHTNGMLFSPRTPMMGAIPAHRSTGMKPFGKHHGKLDAKDLCRIIDPRLFDNVEYFSMSRPYGFVVYG